MSAQIINFQNIQPRIAAQHNAPPVHKKTTKLRTHLLCASTRIDETVCALQAELPAEYIDSCSHLFANLKDMALFFQVLGRS